VFHKLFIKTLLTFHPLFELTWVKILINLFIEGSDQMESLEIKPMQKVKDELYEHFSD